MSIQAIDYLVHFSNILLLVAYSVRDILWLRWFAVAAALTNIPYFLLQDAVLWPPVIWALVFTGINLYQIARAFISKDVLWCSRRTKGSSTSSGFVRYGRESLSHCCWPASGRARSPESL
jgi:hypothetical protein